MPGISFDRAVAYYDATRGYPPGVAEQIRDAIIRETNADHTTRFLEFKVNPRRPSVQMRTDSGAWDLGR